MFKDYALILFVYMLTNCITLCLVTGVKQTSSIELFHTVHEIT